MRNVHLTLTMAEAEALELMAAFHAPSAVAVVEGQSDSTENDVFSALDKLKAAIRTSKEEAPATSSS